MEAEARKEVVGLVLEHGRPVKDEEWAGEDDWRDFDWDHLGNGCLGWQETEQSEVGEVVLGEWTLVVVTHCRCACRLHPHVTVGLEAG